MSFLLTPARSAMASMRAPPKPWSANSVMAARRISSRLRSASRERISTTWAVWAVRAVTIRIIHRLVN